MEKFALLARVEAKPGKEADEFQFPPEALQVGQSCTLVVVEQCAQSGLVSMVSVASFLFGHGGPLPSGRCIAL